MATISECRYRWLRLSALNLPSDRAQMFDGYDQSKFCIGNPPHSRLEIVNVAARSSRCRQSRFAIGPCGRSRRRELDPATLEMPAGDGEEAPVAQFLPDQEVMQVAPCRALHDDLLLHQLIAHRPALRAFDDVEVRPDAVARRVANDALDVTGRESSGCLF